MCFLLNTFQSLEKSHGNSPKLVFYYLYDFLFFDLQWKFGEVFTEYSDNKKHNHVTTNVASL